MKGKKTSHSANSGRNLARLATPLGLGRDILGAGGAGGEGGIEGMHQLFVAKCRRPNFLSIKLHIGQYVEGLYCKRPIQCLASSEILTPHPLTAPRVCTPPGGGHRHTRWVKRGWGVNSSEDARLCSVLYICKYIWDNMTVCEWLMHNALNVGVFRCESSLHIYVNFYPFSACEFKCKGATWVSVQCAWLLLGGPGFESWPGTPWRSL
jgi:hypothetical protein